MDNYKTISIKLNGKESTIPSNNGQKNDSLESSYQEQAASIENSYEPDDLVEYEKKHNSGDIDEWLNLNRPIKSHKRIPPVFKVFGFAAISATLIGVSLGFIMLRMFAGIDNEGVEAAQSTEINPPAVTSTNEASNQTTEESNPGNSASTTALTLDGMEAYIVQGGVFSSMDQAQVWQQHFDSVGIPTMIWENGDEYRIFAGISDSEVYLDEKVSGMSNVDLELYIRPWQTDGFSVDVSSSAADWLEGFLMNWNSTLSLINQDSSHSELATTWEQWLEKTPDTENSLLQGLSEEAKAFVEVVNDDASMNQLQIQLLHMWKAYTNIGKE
ncbi:hypothetical protein [Aquibacillus albus]|uniref:SPOR domain-containing protein n=1 Tax=Aquibacillus albus TaxID=1168171 RepID=A0ABS2N288_9BACI|nr:hypothetical protein [Aquibacillus albus]MBM7572025.1 hypothetical protein [Aquibacillus albus]